jgi:beta-glucosidase-like glycosyl hydrolase
MDLRTVFNGVPSSCFPCSTGLGSSFDIDLAIKVGKALGDEARAKGKLTGKIIPRSASLFFMFQAVTSCWHQL